MQKTMVAVQTESDTDYAAFEKLIASRVASHRGPLFTTDADELFSQYLAGIPEQYRQHYTCHCCRRFVENYGGLAAIDDSGRVASVLWNPEEVSDFFSESVVSLRERVSRAKITGVFVNGAAVWGNPVTGNWTHLSGTPPIVFKSLLKTASQESAEKTQDYITLKRGMADFSLEAAVQAVRVLEADAVDRSEKTLGVAQWFLKLHQSVADVKGRSRDNLIWRAVAQAPPGWCHVRSTMINTLLDDIVQGLPFDDIKRRWDAKMHPLRYQRPQAAPKEGNIAQANKIVEKLQSEGALARRFARLDDITTALWRPRFEQEAPKKKEGGAFDHLKARGAGGIKEVDLPAKSIAWDKFRDEVLPDALEIWASIPSHGAFYGLVTAANADVPPILQWDGLEGMARNPVSWYFWYGGSPAAQWGLSVGWNQVAVICLKPCHWQSDKFVHQSPGVFFAIESARESRMSGNAIFPETLRAEYHGIRSVIEAYSRGAEIAGMSEGNANGISIGGGNVGSITVRVRSQYGVSHYRISSGPYS